MRTLAAFGVLAAWAAGLRAHDPPRMFRGAPAHTGVYDTAGAVLVGLQWVFPTGGDLIGSPAVADGTVHVTSGDGHLYALDLATGANTGATRSAPPPTRRPP